MEARRIHINLPLPFGTLEHLGVHTWNGQGAFSPECFEVTAPPGILLEAIRLNGCERWCISAAERKSSAILPIRGTAPVAPGERLVFTVRFYKPLEHNVVIDLIVDGEEE